MNFENNLTKIDKNFAVESFIVNGETFYDAGKPPFDIYGMYYSEKEGDFRKFPTEIGEKMNLGFKVTSDNTTGGRIRFKTNSPYLIFKVTERIAEGKVSRIMAFTTLYGISVYSNDKFVSQVSPELNNLNFDENKVEFERKVTFAPIDDAVEHEIKLFFPLYGGVKKLSIGVKEGCYIKSGCKYEYTKPIAFYGNSITQGSCASRPGCDLVGLLSDMLDTDVFNVSASGSCRGEQFTCEYLASLNPSIYVFDYDHNAPSVEHLQNTHYNLYKTVRNAHGQTPIVMLSRTNPQNYADGYLRKAVIKATYDKAVEQGDKNVYFVDGETLLPKENLANCTVDGCHLNDFGFYFMAKNLYPLLKKLLEQTK
ncbi:MAG: hypothetical protein IKZ38_04115 [Clostridia bacterium]|nr:hypothetical protein [Clostridia bacterium]